EMKRASSSGWPRAGVLAGDGPHRFCDALHFCVAHRRENRQRDEAFPLGIGDREVVRPIGKSLLVVRMKMKRAPVNAGADSAAIELPDEIVAIDVESLQAQPKRIEVPGVLSIGPRGWQLDLGHTPQKLGIARGDAPSRRGQSRRLAQLLPPERRSQVREVVLEPRGKDLVVPAAARAV